MPTKRHFNNAEPKNNTCSCIRHDCRSSSTCKKQHMLSLRMRDDGITRFLSSISLGTTLPVSWPMLPMAKIITIQGSPAWTMQEFGTSQSDSEATRRAKPTETLHEHNLTDRTAEFSAIVSTATRWLSYAQGRKAALRPPKDNSTGQDAPRAISNAEGSSLRV